MIQSRKPQVSYAPPAKVPPGKLGEFAANFPEYVSLGTGEQCWIHAGIAASFRPSEVAGVWSVVFGQNLSADFRIEDFKGVRPATLYADVMKEFWADVKPELVTATVPEDPNMIEEALEVGFTLLGGLPLRKTNFIILGWRLSQ